MTIRSSVVFLFAATALLSMNPACSSFRRSSSDPDREIATALARGDSSRAIKLLESRIGSPDARPDEFALLGSLQRSAGSIVDRLRSQRALERGLDRYPDHPRILVELGKTYYEQTFFGDAERCFSRVLELDTNHCDAHYYLGINAYRKWKHVQPYTHHLTTAASHLRPVIECAPKRTDAFFKLAFAHYVQGDSSEAIETCESYLHQHPPRADVLFLIGVIAYESGDLETCWRNFRDAFATLTEDEQQNYLDISLLISGDERDAYDLASKEEKKTIRRVYWTEHDPDPTTELNERLLEHVYRMYLSEILFAMTRPPLRGWESERGRALVKFGKPTQTRTTLEGTQPHDGRMEIWSYLTPGEGFILYFRDEFLNGNYIVPMDYKFSYAAQTLFNEPPTTEIIPETALVPGILDVLAFRDSSLASTVYLAMAVDLDSLEHHLTPWIPGSYVVRTAFYDSEGHPQSFHADTVPDATLRLGRQKHNTSGCIVSRYELPFSRYRVALSLEDPRAIAQTLVWADANTLRYIGSSLSVSDILLFHTPPDPEGWPVISRSGNRYVPNPRRQYETDDKLRLYLEIYNLSLTASRSDYEVTYSIYAAEETSSRWKKIGRGVKWLLQIDTSPDPVISQTLQRRGARHEASEELAIDIDALKPGDYVLSVTVTDQTSGDTASSSKPFTKMAEALD
ncbi:MAG: GWxTD domain-containing protein [Candidatus Latescibacterota bacterium]|nr:MAG: GWxTD domain-containing protein [Candidatus Latescibacterota bacterium]